VSPLQRKTRLAPGKPLERKSWMSSGGKLSPKRAPLPSKVIPVAQSKAAKERAKELRLFGTAKRAAWWKLQPCVCLHYLEGKRHPKCTDGGLSERSHVVTRATGGDASDITPKTTGCHTAWHASPVTYCAQLGTNVEAIRKLAREHYATIGDDAPHPPGEQT